MSKLPEGMRVKGKVVRFFDDKGHGFIRPNLEGFPDVFISYSEIEPERKGFKSLVVGDIVEFDVTENEHGYYAKNLKIVRE